VLILYIRNKRFGRVGLEKLIMAQLVQKTPPSIKPKLPQRPIAGVFVVNTVAYLPHAGADEAIETSKGTQQ
jgi:hypothetical protein